MSKKNSTSNQIQINEQQAVQKQQKLQLYQQEKQKAQRVKQKIKKRSGPHSINTP